MQAILASTEPTSASAQAAGCVDVFMRQSQEFPQRRSTEEELGLLRTAHRRTYGSSLGPAIHGILASDLDKAAEATSILCKRHWWIWRICAAILLMGFTELLPVGVAGGGFRVRRFPTDGTRTRVTPHLPPSWTRLHFKIHWRGDWHEFDLRPVRTSGDHLDGVLTDTAEFHYRACRGSQMKRVLPFRYANEALRVYLEGIADANSRRQAVPGSKKSRDDGS